VSKFSKKFEIFLINKNNMDVSRSGRIRKKSSKLADFESSADIDLSPMTSASTSGKKKSKELTASHTVMSSSQTVSASLLRLCNN